MDTEEEMEIIFDALYSRSNDTLEQALFKTQCEIDPIIIAISLGLRMYENLRVLIASNRIVINDKIKVQALDNIDNILCYDDAQLTTNLGKKIEDLLLMIIDNKAAYYEIKNKWYYQDKIENFQ